MTDHRPAERQVRSDQKAFPPFPPQAHLSQHAPHVGKGRNPPCTSEGRPPLFIHNLLGAVNQSEVGVSLVTKADDETDQ